MEPGLGPVVETWKQQLSGGRSQIGERKGSIAAGTERENDGHSRHLTKVNYIRNSDTRSEGENKMFSLLMYGTAGQV